MKNYAVLLGVFEYKYTENLLACKNDVDILHQMIDATQKYKVLELDTSISKNHFLEQVDSFIPDDMCSDKDEVGEIFFYFSGHGVHQESESYLVLHETQLDKINSTSIKNSELDAIIRRKSPKLYVKIVDACYSGMSYIKAPTSKENTPIAPPVYAKVIENCIFMYSSKKDQVSWATKEYSNFTKSFINAILESTDRTIKYNDIINFITDDFEAAGNEQVPYFVTQYDGRDVFSERNEQVNVLIAHTKSLIVSNVSGEEAQPPENSSKIADYLSRYHSQEAVKSIIESMKGELNEVKIPTSWITAYYSLKPSAYGSHNHYEERSIVKFLYDRRQSENLHVDVETNKESRSTFQEYLGIPSFTTIPIKFSSLVGSLPSFYSLDFQPSKTGLPRYELSYVFVYSDTYLYVFTASKQYIQKGWTEYIEKESIKYSYRKIYYYEYSQEQWAEYVKSDTEKCVEFIESSLEKFVGQI